MPIEFQCPRCQAPLTVADSQAGQKQRCPTCQGKLRVPVPATSSSTAASIEFLCPRCQAPLTVPADSTGKKQRCPQCQGKLRVPAPTAGLTSAVIEFLCPRCQAAMRVPGEATGTKQYCPKCGGKVRVPAPSLPAASDTAAGTIAQAAASPADKFHSQQSAELQNAATDLEDDDVPEGIPAMRASHHINLAGVLFPLACVGILAAVAAFLLHTPEPKLEGTLESERLTDLEFGPFRLDNEFLGKPVREARETFNNLESEPIRAASTILMLEFQGSKAGISIVIQPGDGSEFCRVDPRQDRHLAKYLDKEKDRFEAARNQQLSESVPEFLKAVENRSESQRDRPDLAEFRNAVGLPAICRGFGLQVQAVIDRQAYPCVHEDAEGALYFSLPLGTREFELTGRENPPKASRNDAPFSGRYKILVAKEPVTVNKEIPDPKKKIRKLLRE